MTTSWEYRIDELDNEGSSQYLIKQGSPDGVEIPWQWGTLNDLGAEG